MLGVEDALHFLLFCSVLFELTLQLHILSSTFLSNVLASGSVCLAKMRKRMEMYIKNCHARVSKGLIWTLVRTQNEEC